VARAAGSPGGGSAAGSQQSAAYARGSKRWISAGLAETRSARDTSITAVAGANSLCRRFRSGTILTLVLLLGFCGSLHGAEVPGKTPQQNKFPDLVVHQVSLSQAGSVIYQVANSGSSGTGGVFVVDIYVDGLRKDSIRHEALPAMSVQTVQSNLARFADCQRGSIRLVVDAQNTVREINEKNNEYGVQLTAACSKAPK
jgi:CARDB